MPVTEKHRMDLADADSLQAFYLAQTSTETQFIQLSAGAALLEGESLDLGRIRLLRVAAEGHHFWEDHMAPGEWRFAILSEAKGSAKLGGIDLSPTLGCLLRPGDQSDLLLNGSYNTLEITFDAALAEDLGWKCSPGQLAILDEAPIRALRETADAALAVFEDGSGGEKDHRSAGHADLWSSLILDLMEQTLRPWLQIDGNDKVLSSGASADLLRRTRSAFHDLDYAKSAQIDQLSRDLGVSRRTLFHAFKKELGLGPRRFNELLRLNLLRARLYRHGRGDATVTECANDLGFSELGRMAVAYRAVFGESPRETLNRRS